MKKHTDAGQPVDFWISQLDSAKKREKNFLKSGRRVIARYRDERDENDAENKVNILWSNTETLKSALFTRVGNPDVRRQFPKPGLDEKISRTAAFVMERALVSSINRYDLGYEIEGAVEDMLLPGRGTCWVEMDVDGNKRSVRAVLVGWDDFRHGAGKRWENIPWVGRRHYFSEEDIKRDFSEFADKVSFSAIDSDYKDSHNDEELDIGKRAEVWEIWDKSTATRLYVSPDCPVILRSDSDPYHLEGFFPTPRPLYGVITTNSLVPQAEFKQYQDQAAELDLINARINVLVDLLKYAGVYDKSVQDADTLAQLGNLKDGQFIPYNGAGLSDRGGLASVFQVRDLNPIIQSLAALREHRERVLQTIYEITGISDIMRGATAEYETFGAQDIKARFGSQRFNKKQRAVQNFIRDLMRMKAELIAEHFSREQLEVMTGIAMPTDAKRAKIRDLLARGAQAQQARAQAAQVSQMPPVQAIAAQNPELASTALQMLPVDPLAGIPPEAVAEMQALANAVTWEEVSAILRSDDRRNYNISIETDVTAFENTEGEKKQRLEYLNTMQGLMETSIPAVIQNPTLAPTFKEIILFASKAFKVGRNLEDTLEEMVDNLIKSPPPPAAANPLAEIERQKLETEVELAKIRIERDKQVAALEIEEAKVKLQIKQTEVFLQQRQLEMKATGVALENENKTKEARIKELELELKALKMVEDHQPRPTPIQAIMPGV